MSELDAAIASLPERIAITGAAGFIGKHLVRCLVNKGIRPTLLARTPESSARALGFADRVDWAPLDLLDRDSLEPLLMDHRPQLLIHLAGTLGHVRDGQDAVRCAELNVAATVRVLKAATTASVGRVIILGSAAEYGTQVGPLREDMPLLPNSVYGASKAAATQFALAMHSAEQCPVVILRPFSVYGPGQSTSLFIGEAVERAVRNEALRMSTGEHQQDAVFVADVVEAILRASVVPGLEGRVINVGTGRSRRLRRFR